jgi:hypothetical protein
LALYVRSIKKSRHGTPKAFAKLCADNGLRWVALGGPWHDVRKVVPTEIWINRPSTIKRYADALSAAEVKPHVWGYPWHDRVEEFVRDMSRCTGGSIVGWLLDPELGLKRHPAAARELVRLCRERNPYLSLGFTSYGLPHGHRTFPFDEFAEPGGFYPFKECDYGSPQLYDMPKVRVRKGMTDYAALGFDVVVPSYGTYKWVKRDLSKPMNRKNRRAVPMPVAELDAHMQDFMVSEVPVRAMVGWAENFVGRPQWRVLAKWAELLQRGALALPAR